MDGGATMTQTYPRAESSGWGAEEWDDAARCYFSSWRRRLGWQRPAAWRI